jgi:hypothetical protein
VKSLNPRPTLRRVYFVTLIVLLLTLLAVVCISAFGAAWSPTKEERNIGGNISPRAVWPNAAQSQDLDKEFNDDDLKVKEERARGKWGFSTMLDTKQMNDPSIPVYVHGIQSLSGGGKYLGITKIKRVKINNRGSKAVNSIQLRWTVANFDDPEKVLAEDTTPFIKVWVEANSIQTIEIPTLYPIRLLRQLAKDGDLYGHFRLTMSVQEAHFADGSSWVRREQGVYSKPLYLDDFLESRFPHLASLGPGIALPRASPTNSKSSDSMCEAPPGVTTPTVFYACTKYFLSQ